MTLAGTTALVTGATSGIGLETARQLAAAGARVLVHGRTPDKAQAAASDVALHGTAEPVHGDFERLDEVRELAAQVTGATSDLDILVNNAGVFMNERRTTADGHEVTFQVNHLAPFLLTNLLVPAVCSARAARVVTVSSVAHFRGELDFDDLENAICYDGYIAYATSKLENVLFAQEFARRLHCDAATSNALHPGTIATKLLEAGFPSANGAAVSDGAASAVYLATAPEVAGVTGAYFVERRQAHASPKTRDPEVAKRLWDISSRMVAL